MAKRILIVGGVAGGASAAARLRRLDENATIVLFERGPDVSFANCGFFITSVEKSRSVPSFWFRRHKSLLPTLISMFGFALK